MGNIFYIILGEVAENEYPTFWSVNKRWTIDLDKAAHYNKEVLTTTPPLGTTGIMTIGGNGEPTSTYEVIPSPTPGESPLFFHIPH